MGKHKKLMDRLTQNLNDYHTKLLGMEKEALISSAVDIGAVYDAHYYMTEHHSFDNAQMDYLLKFQDPLQMVADSWRLRTDDINGIHFALRDVFDNKDTHQRYPLATQSSQQRATKDGKPSIKERLAGTTENETKQPHSLGAVKKSEKDYR